MSLKKFEYYNNSFEPKYLEKYQDDLDKYVSGESQYSNHMNMLMSSSSFNKEYYSLLGKYFIDSFLSASISQTSNIFKLIDYYINSLKDPFKSSKQKKDLYRTIGIVFICEVLNEETLDKIFGEVLYHNEFGEGFSNDTEDDDSEKICPFEYGSYFETVGNVKLHIGFDHRGTSIEVEEGATAEDFFEALKILVDKVIKILK